MLFSSFSADFYQKKPKSGRFLSVLRQISIRFPSAFHPLSIRFISAFSGSALFLQP